MKYVNYVNYSENIPVADLKSHEIFFVHTQLTSSPENLYDAYEEQRELESSN